MLHGIVFTLREGVMKKKRGIQSFLILLMAICMVVPFSVKAATQTQDGLTVSLTTDKENYAQDEDIQVILSVTNEGNDPVSNISLENIIPEGYEISDGSSQEMQLDMLEIGETVNLETVYSPSLEEDTEPTEDTEIQPGQSDKNDEDTNDSDSAKTEIMNRKILRIKLKWHLQGTIHQYYYLLLLL